jgi:hypothetical protein
LRSILSSLCIAAIGRGVLGKKTNAFFMTLQIVHQNPLAVCYNGKYENKTMEKG